MVHTDINWKGWKLYVEGDLISGGRVFIKRVWSGEFDCEIVVSDGPLQLACKEAIKNAFEELAKPKTYVCRITIHRTINLSDPTDHQLNALQRALHAIGWTADIDNYVVERDD